MVTNSERIIVKTLYKLRIWKLFIQMRIVWITPKFGTAWLFNWMRNRQVVDSLHHAPCCPANHYHRTRLVFSKCNCGAQKQATK